MKDRTIIDPELDIVHEHEQALLSTVATHPNVLPFLNENKQTKSVHHSVFHMEGRRWHYLATYINGRLLHHLSSAPEDENTANRHYDYAMEFFFKYRDMHFVHSINSYP